MAGETLGILENIYRILKLFFFTKPKHKPFEIKTNPTNPTEDEKEKPVNANSYENIKNRVL